MLTDRKLWKKSWTTWLESYLTLRYWISGTSQQLLRSRLASEWKQWSKSSCLPAVKNPACEIYCRSVKAYCKQYWYQSLFSIVLLNLTLSFSFYLSMPWVTVDMRWHGHYFNRYSMLVTHICVFHSPSTDPIVVLWHIRALKGNLLAYFDALCAQRG